MTSGSTSGRFRRFRCWARMCCCVPEIRHPRALPAALLCMPYFVYFFSLFFFVGRVPNVWFKTITNMYTPFVLAMLVKQALTGIRKVFGSHPLLHRGSRNHGAILLSGVFSAFFVRFVSAAFLATVFIPDSGDSGAPYFMHLAIPFFAVKGVREVGCGPRYVLSTGLPT